VLWHVDAPLAEQIAHKDGSDTSKTTCKQICQSGKSVSPCNEQHIAQRQTAKSRVSSKQTNADEETARWSNKKGSISDGSDKGEQQGPCNIDEQNVGGPCFAKPALHEVTEHDTKQCATKSSCQHCKNAPLC
jgi:hypothetical protein